jgi:hypothetical protein
VTTTQTKAVIGIAGAAVVSALAGRVLLHGASNACGMRLNTAPVAFCETFDHPFPVTNRSGQLDGTLWGASRILGAIVLGSNLFNSAPPSTMDACGVLQPASPGTTDVIVCNGQLRESQYDQHGVSSMALYPKQPFTFAGRTRTIAFDVSTDTSGSHGAWPEFWITDQPVPAPFTHGGLPCDLCSVPRNGLAIDLSGGISAGQAGPGDCPADKTRRWTVSQVKIVRNYVEQHGELYSDPHFQALGCAREATGPNDALNHVEVRVSQNQIDIYATDPGSKALKHLAAYSNANLSFSRGLIWLEDNHYNAEKAADRTTGTPDLSNHTFAWDNVAFDGPTPYRDLSFDVPDALQPTAYGLTNLGWRSTPASPVTLSTLPMTQANIDAAASANRGALLMFNFGNNAISTFSYTINGHAHTAPSPFTPAPNKAFQSVALPVLLTDLVPGAQSIVLSGDSDMMVTNVNIVLIAAAAVPGAAPPH